MDGSGFGGSRCRIGVRERINIYTPAYRSRVHNIFYPRKRAPVTMTTTPTTLAVGTHGSLAARRRLSCERSREERDTTAAAAAATTRAQLLYPTTGGGGGGANKWFVQQYGTRATADVVRAALDPRPAPSRHCL